MRMRLLVIAGVLFVAACPSAEDKDGGGSDAGTRDRSASADATGRDTIAVDRVGSDAEESDSNVPCTPDDTYEENDEATAAKAITAPGTVSSLVGCDDDWFSFTAPANQGIEVVITFDSDVGDLDLELYAASDTSDHIDRSAGTGDTDAVGGFFTAATPLLIRVDKYSGGRVLYTVEISFVSPPTNELCTSATAITPGTSISASTRLADNDYEFFSGTTSCTRYSNRGPDVVYTVSLPAGQWLTAWLDSSADLAMYLVENCSSLCCWAGVDYETGGTTEVLVYRNVGGSTQNLYLIVDGYNATSLGNFGLNVAVGATWAPDAGVEDAGPAVTNCKPNVAPDGGARDN